MRTKIFFFIGLITLFTAAGVWAQEESTEETNSEDITWGAYFQPGDISTSIGLGFSGWGYGGIGLNVSPGLELTLAQVNVADVIPLSFGVSGRGNVALYSGYWSAGGIFANAGAYGTIHLGFRDFDLEIEELKNIDIYTGIGIVFDILQPAYADYSLFHFASY
ncbi:MAG: hypothetical protein ACOCVC_03705, partial [Spirochaeta sp.]